MIHFLLKLMESLLPSFIRTQLLRAQGAHIGKNSKIGIFTIIDAKNIYIGENVVIGSGNLIHRIRNLTFETGSRIDGCNWITGARKGSFFVGLNSAITRFHFFESSGDITIEENVIVAGRGSYFFTHGITPTNLNDVRAITIKSWSYIGSSTRFVPGSGVSKGTFVGMGAVVSKLIEEEYVLVAGNPAVIKRKFSRSDAYFNREYLPHAHHPKGYVGGK